MRLLHGWTRCLRIKLMMAPSISRLLAAVLLSGIACAFTACRGPAPEPVATEPSSTSISLKDQQLIDILRRERELDARAARPDAEFTEIQRLFHQVDQLYASFFSRNPDDLDSRLLYGKFLTRFHDLEGARTQFLIAAKIAERSGEQVAVIHQQLSTICAEQGDYSRAVVFADNAVKMEPDVAAYQYGLGQILAAYRQQLIEDEAFLPDDIDKAIFDCFQSAKELEPDSLPLKFRFGEAFYDVGTPDWQEALLYWQNLQAHPGLSPIQSDAVRLHQARCFIELGQPDKARLITSQIDSPQIKSSADSLF
jgi:tetratricopeptide (TPR) repeat protein